MEFAVRLNFPSGHIGDSANESMNDARGCVSFYKLGKIITHKLEQEAQSVTSTNQQCALNVMSPPGSLGTKVLDLKAVQSRWGGL